MNETRDQFILQSLKEGRSSDSIAKEWGITRQRVWQIVARADYPWNEHWRSNTDTQPLGWIQGRRWNDEEMLQILVKVTEELGPMSVQKWAAISAERGLPSVALYIQRFRTWNRAKEEAGLPIRGNRAYIRLFSDDDIIDSVAEFLKSAESDGARFGAKHYERWAKALGRPSLALIRARLGKWSEVKQMAILRNQERA